MFFLKRNTAVSLPFAMVDSTDFDTGESGLAVGDISACYRRDGDSSWTVTSGQVSSASRGFFTFDLSASDTNDSSDFIMIECTASGAAIYRDIGQLVDEIPGDQDFAVTVTDAKRIRAVGATMSVAEIEAHADANTTNTAATTRPNCLIETNVILGVVGKTEIVGSAGNIYKSDGTTIAVARTVTYAGAGSEGVAGLA